LERMNVFITAPFIQSHNAMLKVAVIGLDTSHSIEFARRMQAPDCPRNQRVSGLQAVSCLRFETPYQNKEGLDKRQKQLEQWGIKVTENIDEALEGCDAIMLEINDGNFHLEYFRKVCGLGKPVFLDKPLAMTLSDGRAIIDLMRKHNTRVWSGSSVPFCPSLAKILKEAGHVERAHVFGPMGDAPSGDSLVWYGVHTFELLQRIMGRGARQVSAIESEKSVVVLAKFSDGREGTVELTRKSWAYGGTLWGTKVIPFLLDASSAYGYLLRQIKGFFRGGRPPVDMETTFEGLAMMCAARKSIETNKPAEVEKL